MRPESLFPLFAPIASLKGVGPKLAPLVERAAGPLVRDLLFLSPTGVVEREVVTIADAVEGAAQIFVVRIDAHQGAGGKAPYRIRCADETGFLHLVWFRHGGPHLSNAHPVGAVRAVSGKVEFFNNEKQIPHPDYLLPPERAGRHPRARGDLSRHRRPALPLPAPSGKRGAGAGAGAGRVAGRRLAGAQGMGGMARVARAAACAADRRRPLAPGPGPGAAGL